MLQCRIYNYAPGIVDYGQHFSIFLYTFGGSAVGRGTSAQGFRGRTRLLGIQPAEPRREAWLGRNATHRPLGGLSQQLEQALHRVGAVALLGAKALRDNDNPPVARQATAGKSAQALLHRLGKTRRAIDVKAQLNGARHLVDVLPARPGGAHETFLDPRFVNEIAGVDPDHQRLRVACFRLVSHAPSPAAINSAARPNSGARNLAIAVDAGVRFQMHWIAAQSGDRDRQRSRVDKHRCARELSQNPGDERVQGKVVIEEHFAMPETNGVKNRVVNAYWDGLNANLLDFESKRLLEMDACGVEMAIVSLNAPAIQAIADPHDAANLARRANDALAEQVRKRPHRFQGFAALPLQDPDAAILELQRCVRDFGFKGALVNGFSNAPQPGMALYYDAPQYRAFFAEMQALDVPFYLHPRDPLTLERYDGHPWLVGSAWSFAEETSLHALKLMGSGLFDAFPKLQLVLGHLGERVPYDIWRLDHRLQFRHDYPARQKMGHYLRHNVHVTTSGHFRTQTLVNAMLEMGADRIMFAIDYPYEENARGAAWFDSAEISETDRNKIGRRNANQLFRLGLE